MNRTALVVAVAASIGLGWPARADTTIKSQDGTVELTVPNGWREGKPFGPGIKVVALSARGATVLVRVVSKEDFRDLKAVVDVALERLKKNMPDAEPKMEDVKVNDKPAIRVSVEGTQANGQRKGFLLTFFETDGNYVDVAATANASIFKSEEPVLAGLAGQVKILPATGAAAPTTPPAAGQAAPPATAQTPAPAATRPASVPPSTRMPR